MSKYATSITMAVGDVRPIITHFILEEETNAIIDLSSAIGVKFFMYPRNDDGTLGTVKVNGIASTIVDATGGKVTHTWVGTETDTAGRFIGFFEIDWGAGPLLETVGAIEITFKPRGIRMSF